jgi:hypothetical protein
VLRGEQRDARQSSTLATGRSGSFASRRLCDAHFRCSLISGHSRDQSAGLERANSGHHQVRASMQGKPKQVRAYETTPEPSTRGVVDIT